MRVTKTAWFGPKRYGWGWSPRTWQGWVITIAMAVLGQVASNLLPRRAALATLGLVAAYLGVVVLTGDPPGSRHGTGDAGVDAARA